MHIVALPRQCELSQGQIQQYISLPLARIIPQIRAPVNQSTAQNFQSRYAEALEKIEAGWILEAFLLLCSAACMVSIVLFLIIHHDTPLASWTFYFSLNTVISVLGTLYRSTLIMAVSAAVAQGKCVWFRKRPSSLSTFETIDAGSRETLGSFKLLWYTRGQ